MVHACALNPTAAQTNVERVRLFFVLLSQVAHRHASQDGTSIMHSAMTSRRLMGATLDIAAGAAELRRADRNGCTLSRNRAWRASSNRGSARARYCDIEALDHRSEAAVRYPIGSPCHQAALR
jgi:hypothetical protein